MTDEKNARADDAASSREAYSRERESALRRLDAKLDELKKKTLSMTAGTRQDLDRAMRELGEKRKRFVARLDSLRGSGGVAWNDLKKGVDDSWGELEDALDDLRSGVGKALGRFTGRGDS